MSRRGSPAPRLLAQVRQHQARPDLALVIGSENEVTVQCEGPANVLSGPERARCLSPYFDQYPDGRERARDPDVVHVRVRPRWLRYSDYRPDSFVVEETRLEP